LKPGGTAILNADDARVAAMRAKHSGPALTFGLEKEADVTAAEVERAGLGLSRFTLRTPSGEARAELPMPGRHNLLNALAASAVAHCFGMSAGEIAEALATAAPSQMRGEVLSFREGFTLVDDSYNSNPRSLLAMTEAVAQGGEGVRRRIVVAGEMRELGADSAAIHRETGREVAGVGPDVLWGVEGHARELVEGAREAGMREADTAFFENSEEAARALAEFVTAGDLVLVKGSRGVHTEKVVERLKERYEQSDE
jgi:UDP-N-acetylmuramoyl-tripeptide--D-alanyl-D-alanine ligase